MGHGSWAYAKGIARGRFLAALEARSPRRTFLFGVVLGTVLGVTGTMAMRWLL